MSRLKNNVFEKPLRYRKEFKKKEMEKMSEN